MIGVGRKRSRWSVAEVGGVTCFGARSERDEHAIDVQMPPQSHRTQDSLITLTRPFSICSAGPLPLFVWVEPLPGCRRGFKLWDAHGRSMKCWPLRCSSRGSLADGRGISGKRILLDRERSEHKRTGFDATRRTVNTVLPREGQIMVSSDLKMSRLAAQVELSQATRAWLVVVRGGMIKM